MALRLQANPRSSRQQNEEQAMRQHRFLFNLGVVCIGVGLVALGFTYDDDVPRQPVSGLVRLDGRPLSTGTISFTPVGHESSSVWPSREALIRGGRFSIARPYGLRPSKYRIAVFPAPWLKRRFTPNDGSGKDESVASALIPAKYSGKTTLEFEVSDPVIKELTIDLKSD
jgi:hypothetical protein